MLVLYLLLTLVMGTAIVVGIVKTQTAEVEGKMADGSVVRKSWREWGAGRETRVNQVEPAKRGDILSSDGKVLATTVSECDLYLDLGKKYDTDAKGKKKFSGAVSDSVLFASLDTMALMLSESMGKHGKERAHEGASPPVFQGGAACALFRLAFDCAVAGMEEVCGEGGGPQECEI